MNRTLATDCQSKIGQLVKLQGWVETRRDHGKLIFIDFRDRSGLVQVVCDKKAKELRPEYVVEVEGQVKKRPPKLVNLKIETGKIEIEAGKLTILNRSETLPFPIDTEGLDIEEEIRLNIAIWIFGVHDCKKILNYARV